MVCYSLFMFANVSILLSYNITFARFDVAVRKGVSRKIFRKGEGRPTEK